MPIRLSGLSSGLDTESIVKELMSAQRLKKRKIENKKTKLEWKEEKWKELNKKVYALYTDELSAFKSQGSYLTKNVKTSDSSKATFTAQSSVPAGTHTVEIKSVASSQFVTGSKIGSITAGNQTIAGKDISRSTKLTSLGITEGTTFTLTTKEHGPKEFTVSSSTQLGELMDFTKESGVSMTYDSNNQRFYVSAQESGLDHAFTFTSKMASESLSTNLSSLRSAVGYDYLTADQKSEIDKAIQVIATTKDETSDAYVKANKCLQQYAKAVEDTKANPDSTASAEKFQEIFDANLKKHQSDQNFVGDNQKCESAIRDYKSTYGVDNGSALDILKIGEITQDVLDGKVTNSNATIVTAKDCEIIYNGQTYTSSSNTNTVNGLTINAIEVTDSPLKVTVTNDSDSVYNVIKNFTKKYNSILKEVNELFYAGTAKGYDVLTDEEKEVMTDEQVEKWENKIKGSLLRNDSYLGGIRSTLTSITSMSVKVNGKEYSLASFGIGTSDYTEKGLLHIDGDSDDSTTSSNKDLLRAAIDSDPDLVMEVFSKIGSSLYSAMSSKMSANSVSSALTFYNDKEITSQKKAFESELSNWEKKLTKMEERYYAKFAAMESAISKLNSQTSYITSLFSS